MQVLIVGSGKLASELLKGLSLSALSPFAVGQVHHRCKVVQSLFTQAPAESLTM